MNKAGCLVVLGFIAVVGIMCALTSCCTSVCEQSVPELRDMPDSRSQDMLPCGVYVIEDIIEIPVTPSGK